jgi:hypothetical protein
MRVELRNKYFLLIFTVKFNQIIPNKLKNVDHTVLPGNILFITAHSVIRPEVYQKHVQTTKKINRRN